MEDRIGTGDPKLALKLFPQLFGPGGKYELTDREVNPENYYDDAEAVKESHTLSAMAYHPPTSHKMMHHEAVSYHRNQSGYHHAAADEAKAKRKEYSKGKSKESLEHDHLHGNLLKEENTHRDLGNKHNSIARQYEMGVHHYHDERYANDKAHQYRVKTGQEQPTIHEIGNK